MIKFIDQSQLESVADSLTSAFAPATFSSWEDPVNKSN